MFTGIIEEVGIILTQKRKSNAYELQIKAQKVLEGTKLGDSICVDGVCLTVTQIDKQEFRADVMLATWKATTMKNIRTGNNVNLERAVAVGDRLGGHIVQGHVDGLGKVKQLINNGREYKLEISASKELEPYIISKGSIAINGISLTIQSVKPGSFSTAIIPHTVKSTNLQSLRVGMEVNLETDVLIRKR
ncbi:MAG: riboflavin synthase [Candidatus Margulisiibacteriota bacterium]